jgi:hypothetical protein
MPCGTLSSKLFFIFLFFNFFLASKKKQKLAEVPKSYSVLPKMGIFELSHIDDFHFSLQLRLTLFESSETANHTAKGCVPRLPQLFGNRRGAETKIALKLRRSAICTVLGEVGTDF